MDILNILFILGWLVHSWRSSWASTLDLSNCSLGRM